MQEVSHQYQHAKCAQINVSFNIAQQGPEAMKRKTELLNTQNKKKQKIMKTSLQLHMLTLVFYLQVMSF